MQRVFSVEYFASDTTLTVDYLRRNIVDVGITYHEIAEYSVHRVGIIDRIDYVWKDHWMLVGTRTVIVTYGSNQIQSGPKENPARLPTDHKSSVHGLFASLAGAMNASLHESKPIKFLSR